jgi:5-methyltetrahydrofolate--homocysteine methyltransferase
MANFEELAAAVLDGDAEKVSELVKSLLDKNIEPIDIINKGLLTGMNEVGARFKENEMFVPEVLMAASAMSTGVGLLKDKLGSVEMPTAGSVVIGTVEGDLHDIGKNLVAMMMESCGLKVYNIGVDITPEQFVESVKKYQPDIVAMSALLTTTMINMESTIEALKEAGVRDQVKVIIGGAPISKEFADKIGADGYAPDAASATDLCKKLLN